MACFIILYIPVQSNNVQLSIKSVVISKENYKFTNYLYELIVEINNDNTKSSSTEFETLFCLNNNLFSEIR